MSINREIDFNKWKARLLATVARNRKKCVVFALLVLLALVTAWKNRGNKISAKEAPSSVEKTIAVTGLHQRSFGQLIGKYADLIPWINAALKWKSNRDAILSKFKDTYSKYTVNDNAKPINILCLDGGGMKGYAISGVLSAIQEKYGKDCKDILNHFDLLAGSSVGGAAALGLHQMKNLSHGVDEIRDSLDIVRERVLPTLSTRNFIMEGIATPKNAQMNTILKDLWGHDEVPLLNPKGIPTMVMTTVRTKEDKKSEKFGDIKPFILRTYEYENEGDSRSNQSLRETEEIHTDAVIDSSSSTSILNAAGATSAIPGVIEQPVAEVDGKVMTFGDGAIYLNCPVVAAIDEARRLYPNRPLGAVLSIGFGDENLSSAMRVAKEVNPRMHFHRIVPKQFTESFNTLERGLEKAVLLEENVRNYVLNDKAFGKKLDATMSVLFGIEPFRKSPLEAEKGTLAYKRRQTMLHDKKYVERCRFRQAMQSQSWREARKKHSKAEVTYNDYVSFSKSSCILINVNGYSTDTSTSTS